MDYEVKNDVRVAAPMPVVSVRTVTFNHVAYIRDCIEGVLRQQISFPIEYIIGEDFSTDGTREIVMAYARAYPDIIRVLTADQNVGAAQNAHRCRQACRGKYVALCEGDDQWTDPYKLQKQVDFLESHPDFSGIGTDFCRIDERGRLIKANVIKFHHLKQDGEGNYLALRRLLPGSGRYYPSYTGTLTMLYRNLPGIPEQMQGFRHIPNTDWVLFILMLEHGKIGFLKEITAAYRLHPAQLI